MEDYVRDFFTPFAKKGSCKFPRTIRWINSPGFPLLLNDAFSGLISTKNIVCFETRRDFIYQLSPH